MQRNSVYYVQRGVNLLIGVNRLGTQSRVRSIYYLWQYYTKEEGTSFNFCHFTIQEFLAAYHISTLPSEQQSVYMNNTFWIDRFAYMWVMYVGILGVKNNVFTQFISEGKTYKNKAELKITGAIQKDKKKAIAPFPVLHGSKE